MDGPSRQASAEERQRLAYGFGLSLVGVLFNVGFLGDSEASGRLNEPAIAQCFLESQCEAWATLAGIARYQIEQPTP